MPKRKQYYETTGQVLAQAEVKSVKLTIEYECNIEYLNVEELLERLREDGHAEIVAVEIVNSK